MRAVIQRVSHASVSIEGREPAAIGQGLLVLLGCANDDNDEDITWLVKKITGLRIFDDDEPQRDGRGRRDSCGIAVYPVGKL